MKIRIIALLTALATGVHAATPLWNGTVTGMSAAQVREKFGAAEEPKKPGELFGGAKEELEITNFDYHGASFDVAFFFKSGRLSQVSLSQTTVRDYKALSELAEKIAITVSKELGEPERQVTDDATGKRLLLTWKKPDQRVTIVLIQSGVLADWADYFFHVNFQESFE